MVVFFRNDENSGLEMTYQVSSSTDILSQTFHTSWGCLGVQKVIQKPSARYIEGTQ